MMSHRSNFLKFAVEAVRKGLRSRFALLSFYQLLGPIHRSRWTETLADCCRKSLAGCINSSMAIGLRSLFVQPLVHRFLCGCDSLSSHPVLLAAYVLRS